MSNVTRPSRSGWLWLVVLAGVGAAGVVLYLRQPAADVPPPVTPPPLTPDTSKQVHEFCGACHLFPPPDTFPRSAWKKEVERGYGFFEQSGRALQAPPIEAAVRYFEDRAPLELPALKFDKPDHPYPVSFALTHYPGPPTTAPPAISNVNLVHLFDERRLDVLACDMRGGVVMALKPYALAPAWQVLARVSNPAHTEVVDLDGDGVKDVLVANLGSFSPTDRRCGSVVWLRGTREGGFIPCTLLEGVGRVADVQAADFRGVGKLDLIVAVFGWQNTGEILYLENQTTDWSKPRFVPHVLDERHGTIHVPVADLNGDGRPDFVALISQEHETIVAFLNEGGGRFRKQTLYTASHPGYGSSGIQLVDLDGDGDLDILYTNGDVLDEPYLLKPYHGIQWLENKGDLRFEHHPIAPMYGVHRAVAADLRGTGKKDIVAVSFLPLAGFPERKEKKVDAVIVLEQTAPRQWMRHSLETVTCDHVTCAAGNLFGTGRMDLVIGNFDLDLAEPVTFWKNLGAGK
jgi:hypothetical protein